MNGLLVEVAAGVSTCVILWASRWVIKAAKRVLAAAETFEHIGTSSRELSRAARRAELSAVKLGDVCTRLEAVAGRAEQ